MIPDPNNYTMKGNKQPKANHAPSAFVFIPDMDDEQLRKLTREKLSKALQAIDPVDQPGMTLKLCSEMKDRLDGKPGQAITMDANLSVITVNANVQFIPVARDNLIIEHVDKLQAIENK